MTEETAAARAAFTAPKPLPAPRGIFRGDGAEVNLTPHPHAAARPLTFKHMPNGDGLAMKLSWDMVRELGLGFR